MSEINDSRITCYLLTYNTAGKTLSTKHLHSITKLDLKKGFDVVDIFAFAFQECPKRWSRKKQAIFLRDLNQKLADCLIDTHRMIKSCSLGVLHLVIFVKTELIEAVTDKEICTKSVSRLSKPYRTKGAVAIAFRLNERPFLFINCHFRFGGNFLKRRQDYRRVIDSLSFARYPKVDLDPLTPFDCVFLFGDFNTRFATPRAITKLLNRRRYSFDSDIRSPQIHLVKLDQLHMELQKSRRRSFENFYETGIRFAPTYKFVLNTWRYHWARRVPAYTDRILYRKSTSTAIRCFEYNTIKTVRISDHLPVYAAYEVDFLN